MTSDNPTAAEGLAACPFCGGADICVQDRGVAGQEDWCRIYTAFCNDCGAAGGYYPTEAEAIAAWNTRPIPAGDDLVEVVAAARTALFDLGVSHNTFVALLAPMDHKGMSRFRVPDIGREAVQYALRSENAAAKALDKLDAALAAIGPRAGEVERAIELTFGEAERIIRSFSAIGDHNREGVIATMRGERGAAYILKALAHTSEAEQ